MQDLPDKLYLEHAPDDESFVPRIHFEPLGAGVYFSREDEGTYTEIATYKRIDPVKDNGNWQHVYFAAKPGEERRFASPREYSPSFAKVLKDSGYRIFRISFCLPTGWDSADGQILSELEVVE